MADETLIAAGTIHRSEASDFGTVSEVGPLFRLSRTRRGGHGAAPRVGQHTRDVLTEVGYSPDQIKQFYEEGVVA
jgi:crotonobetainyl-CoA:carnitine CoA-transferase CaiB-like acyl-CoA transferase